MRVKRNGKWTHGKSWMPEYRIWNGMMSRCYNENNLNYEWYGFRGVTVCNRWHRFDCFLKDMGRRPTRWRSIDRIDPCGNYEPSNCRWATPKQQQMNKRTNINTNGKLEKLR